MFAVLTCVAVGHDLRLVAAAALICAIACSAAFGFHLRSLRTAGSMRWAWIGLTGLVAGSGVWATHFVAMLAYQPSLAIAYEIWATAASLAIAVLGVGAGFAAPALRSGRAAVVVGGALTGLSIAGLHYMGIAAVRTQAHILWNDSYVAASVLIGTLGAVAAFDVRSRLRGRWAWTAPALLLMLAICSLHFTAMTAVTLLPDPALSLPGAVIGRGVLAAATGGLAALILAAAGALIWMERLGQRSTLASLRGALDVVPAGLAFFNPEGRLMAWNLAFAGLMAECGVEACAGAPRRVFAEAAARVGWITNATGEGWDYIEGRRTPASEAQLPDGRWIRHEAFRTENGGGVAVLTDVTELRESARAMAERDAAEAANRAKSEFLANMSHEIRTPLNGVLGIADVLMRSELSDKQRDLVGVIRTSGALLNALLTDLLDLARVEAGVAELRPECVDLGVLVASVRDLFAGPAEVKGLALSAEVAPGAATPVICDPVRLRQVLGNLVNNAIKFTDSGAVTLALAREGERVRFEVRDTGPGFDEALKSTLFQRFRQADNTSTRRHGGAGLGLAICQEFVGLMGGELDCTSRPGHGAVFRFTLKLPALGETDDLRVAASEAPAATVAGHEARVLVVDDNAVNRQVLQLILESVGVSHSAVADGEAAVAAVRASAYDAVLMDIQMPGIDGFEATRRIRAWEALAGRRRTPIFIVSANCLNEHVEAGLAAGADGHLNKPITVAELLQALAPQLDSARTAAA